MNQPEQRFCDMNHYGHGSRVGGWERFALTLVGAALSSDGICRVAAIWQAAERRRRLGSSWRCVARSRASMAARSSGPPSAPQ